MAGSSIWNDFDPIGSLIGMISHQMAEINHRFGVISCLAGPINLGFGAIICLGGCIDHGFGEIFGLVGRILDFDFEIEMDFTHYDMIHFRLRICNFRKG